MAGNHFKGSDSGRPAVPPRPNGAGKAGTPGGAGQGGSGKRVSPGETAMFTALYEQSQKAKKTGRARGNVFAGGATSASQPSGAPSVPAPAWMIAVPSLRARVPRKIITILA